MEKRIDGADAAVELPVVQVLRIEGGSTGLLGGGDDHGIPEGELPADTELPLEEIIQEYVWRWDIEVNHRDEKTILGVGQAQVRNPNSAENLPATAVAAYAMLHIAAIKAFGKGGKPAVIPEAKWRRPHKKIRPSMQDLINELRRELFSKAIRPDHLTDFMNAAHRRTKPRKSGPNLCSSLFAATA
jgi:hypothetical protein